MASRSASLDAARAAKRKIQAILQRKKMVRGIGITRDQGVYAVKINLEKMPTADLELPKEIDGVPVVVAVTGNVRKQRASASRP